MWSPWHRSVQPEVIVLAVMECGYVIASYGHVVQRGLVTLEHMPAVQLRIHTLFLLMKCLVFDHDKPWILLLYHFYTRFMAD